MPRSSSSSLKTACIRSRRSLSPRWPSEEDAMLMVVALGGNALLRHGEPVSAEAQRDNVRIAAVQLAKAAAGHDLVIVHGNGPQVGMLAMQAGSFPLDVLDAETEG